MRRRCQARLARETSRFRARSPYDLLTSRPSRAAPEPMTRHRTTARGGLLLTLTAFLAAALVGSPGAAPKPGLVDGKPIVFPLIGDYAYGMNYGDSRANGSHAGIDIENVPWRTPVVAAEAGRIRWHTTSSRAGCMLYLYGKSGTTYLYIHLNNDLTERSEDRGGCKMDVSYAVADGATVTAGEQIAWNGDSGDAEGNHHLHFEVHPGDGGDVNPYPYLNAAERLLFPARLGATFSLGVRGVPIAAGAGTLTLRASAVRWWPGGRWTSLVRDRTIELRDRQGRGGRSHAPRGAREPRATRSPDENRAGVHGIHGTGEGHRLRAPRGGRRARRQPRDAAGRRHGQRRAGRRQCDRAGRRRRDLVGSRRRGRPERSCVYPDPGCSGS